MTRRPERGQIASRSAIAVLGLSFWFLVGFPFANHNESFAWVRSIRDVGAAKAMTPSVPLARTYRPLGQAVAVSTYAVSGRTYLTQIFNYAVAAVAFGVVASAPGATMYTAALAAIVGGAFFAGFIYLFHLHGVFYSPVLLAMVMFVRIFEQPTSSVRADSTAWFVALLGALFHPYALVLFLAAYVGFWLGELREGRRRVHGRLSWHAASIAIATVLLLLAARPAGYQTSPSDAVAGLVTSLASMEVHWLLSALAAVLAVLTAQELSQSVRQRRLIMAGTAAFAVILWLGGFPVLIAWAAACAAQALHSRRYVLAGLVAGAFMLPAISPTGSPTYAVFLLVACVLVTGTRAASVRGDAEMKMPGGAFAVAAAWAVVLLSAVLLRNGVDVPVVSRFAQPLLAEREKTFQLERIIQWWGTSSYKDLPLTLHQAVHNPVSSPGGLDARRTRPPTYQEHLDIHTGSRATSASVSPRLAVTFGDQALPQLTLAYAEPGRFAGAARVYVVSANPPR